VKKKETKKEVVIEMDVVYKSYRDHEKLIDNEVEEKKVIAVENVVEKQVFNEKILRYLLFSKK
jgi:hypothetical protein